MSQNVTKFNKISNSLDHNLNSCAQEEFAEDAIENSGHDLCSSTDNSSSTGNSSCTRNNNELLDAKPDHDKPSTPDSLDNINSLDNIPPAVKVSLTGQHLIEASAGTGKTWTLTGIVLRLLIEARRAPEQIIATTFTRAAAAEMRQRIHDRLVNFYQLLQWVDTLTANPASKEHLYPAQLLKLPKEDQDNVDRQKKAKKSDNTSHSFHSNSSNSNNDESLGLDAASPQSEATDESKNKDADSETLKALRKRRADWLVSQASDLRLRDMMSDPINLHLVGYLLDHVYTYPMNEALRRTALVLTTLDKLFVGTLDSLAQKWLVEYSAETGHQLGMAIIEENSIQRVTDSIIHDELRQFQSRLFHSQPKLFKMMAQKNKLTSVADHRTMVSRALNFISAPIDDITLADSFDFDSLDAAIEAFVNSDIAELNSYYDEGFRKSQGFNTRSSLNTRFEFINEIHTKVSLYKHNYRSYLNEDAHKLLVSIAEAQFPNEEGRIKGFRTKHEKFHDIFFNLPSINTLMMVYELEEQLDEYIASLIARVNRDIVMAVRNKLPDILEERSQTTFSLQMVRLNQALSGNQGQKLARYIRHHYPVALIDESQDVNGEQAKMIKNIYLSQSSLPQSYLRESCSRHNQAFEKTASDNSPSASTSSASKAFLLLVGDPKQAIYGFRGGDVANYNAMKQHFHKNNLWELDVNRRSNENLINALNHWFNRSTSKTPANSLSELGQHIHYHHIRAANSASQLSWLNPTDHANNPSLNTLLPANAVSLLHLPYDKEKNLPLDKFETTARHIATVLKVGKTSQGQPIQPSDIGVLARTKKDLKQLESALTKLGIPAMATSDVSIFETVMASDVAALVMAMLHPYRHDMVNRVLTSHLFGLTVKQVQALMVNHDVSVNVSVNNQVVNNSQVVNQRVQNQSNQNQNNKSTIETVSHTTETSDQIKPHTQLNTQINYQDFITFLKAGAERFEKYGILSAMHFLLDKNPMQPQGVWEALASLANGERYIMDLRQLLDILAQYATEMGAHELIAWFKQNIDAAPNSDWAKQMPLPTDSGVQLMTIHKSKGLEFAIVYVFGMDSPSRKSGDKETFGLYLYNDSAVNPPNHNDVDSVFELSNANPQRSTSTPNKSKLFNSNARENKRRLSPVKGTATNPNFYTDMETNEAFDELKRLGYVAFTRASEQLYIVLQDPSNKSGFSRHPVFQWFASEQAKFELPDRLQNIIGVVEGQDVAKIYDDLISSHSASHPMSVLDDDHRVSIRDTDGEAVEAVNEQGLYAQTNAKVKPILYPAYTDVMQQTYFYGWSKTSFTALARQLDDSSEAIAVVDEKIDDAVDLNDIQPDKTPIHNAQLDEDGRDFKYQLDTLKPEDDIRFSFVRGANAGSFLHEIFEKLDFHNKDQWSQVIDRAVSSYQMPVIYASDAYNRQNRAAYQLETHNDDDGQSQLSLHNQLKQWIDEVLSTPLRASNQPLIHIDAHKRFAELEFNMGLSDTFRAQHINDLFTTYLPEDTSKHVTLSTQQSSHLYRYLRGEIDLVYEHAGKYYVVDYKSNYLGNSLSNYDELTLQGAMTKAGYWLQAAIYQVALHRFLKIRIADYEGNESNYLGAVEYVFLRGTYEFNTQFSANKLHQHPLHDHTDGIEDTARHSAITKDAVAVADNRYGLVTWDIPIEFIVALDDLLGKPNE